MYIRGVGRYPDRHCFKCGSSGDEPQRRRIRNDFRFGVRGLCNEPFGIWHNYKLVRPAEKCGRIFRSTRAWVGLANMQRQSGTKTQKRLKKATQNMATKGRSAGKAKSKAASRFVGRDYAMLMGRQVLKPRSGVDSRKTKTGRQKLDPRQWLIDDWLLAGGLRHVGQHQWVKESAKLLRSAPALIAIYGRNLCTFTHEFTNLLTLISAFICRNRSAPLVGVALFALCVCSCLCLFL